MQGLVKERRYREFLSRFWALNQQDGFPLRIREFDQVMGMIAGGQRLLQNEMNRPYAILSVDSSGNFSTFDPELLSVETERYGLFNLGNIRDLSLLDATEGAVSNACSRRCRLEPIDVGRPVTTTDSAEAETAATNTGSTEVSMRPKLAPAFQARFLWMW